MTWAGFVAVGHQLPMWVIFCGVFSATGIALSIVQDVRAWKKGKK